MQTSYIYSASKANALGEALLNRTDIERLLVATPGEDLQSALKETYLAPHVIRVPEESVPLAIEETLKSAKKLIHRITPQGDMFRVLWVQYDIHNLRVFAKAVAAGKGYEFCEPYLSERGIYPPKYLHEHAEASTLNRLQIGWQEAFSEALQVVQSGDLQSLDGIFDELYFQTSKRIVQSIGDAFMHTYLQALIDVYNLKSRLRHLKNKEVNFTPAFVDGGTFASTQIETIEGVVAMFERLGGATYWAEALEEFQTTGNFTRLDARVADYLLMVARQGSYDMFSSASLVLYYLKCQQAAANIRTIVVGKNSGLPIEVIRANLRFAYVNE
jgi:vacuolar-type H+-ATPase subunit C/Vma6